MDGLTAPIEASTKTKIINFIAGSAPLLASAIGSPVAGMAVSLIANLFGANAQNPDDILAKMSSDPDAYFKLKQLEIQHQDALMQATTNDRMDARKREEAVMATTGQRDWVVDVIAMLVVIGFFAMCYEIDVNKLDQTDHDILYMLCGQLTAGFLMVLSYYFGGVSQKS